MADNNVDILMSVDINASDTLKAIAELRQNAAGLRDEQKQLDRSTAAGREEFERLNAQIKANNKTIQQYERQVVNALTREKAQEGSIKSLRAEMSNAKAAYAEMSREEREGAKGKELLDKTAALNAELKELEAAYGDNQRKVGDYELAGKSLSTELGDLTKNLMDLAAAGLQNSDTYREMVERAIELKNAQDEVNQTIANGAKNTASMDTVLQGVQAVTAAYGAWKSTAALLGIENEELDATMQKLVVVMGALQSLTTLQTLAQKQSIIYQTASNLLQKIRTAQTTYETKALAAKTAMLNADTLATKAGAAATWVWNAALAANPVVLIIAALAALGAGIALTTSAFGKNVSTQKTFEHASKDIERAIKRVDSALRGEIDAIDLNTRKLILAAKQRGATVEELARIELDSLKQTTDANTKAAKEKIELLKQQEQAARDEVIASAEGRKLTEDEIKRLGDIRVEYSDKIREQENAIKSAAQTVEEKSWETSEAIKDAAVSAASAAADSARQRTAAEVEAAIRGSELTQRVVEAQFKAESKIVDDSIKLRQAREAKMFSIQQKGARERLTLQRQNNKITQDEYVANLAILDAEQTAFSNRQTDELNSFFQTEREAIIGMLEKTMDEEIHEVETSYTDAIRRLNDTVAAETEKAELEKIDLIIRLEKQKNAEIERVRSAAQVKETQRLEDARQTELQKVASGLNRDLLLAENNAKKKYDAKVAALNKEAEIYADNADKQLEIARQLADAESELINTRIEKFSEWRNAATDAVDGLNALMSTGLDRELQKVQETYDAESIALADKYAMGLLTEAEYNRDKLKLEKQRAKDEAKIEREKAIRERASKVFSVITDTAMGITKAVAASPKTFGLPWSAFMAATGALNLVNILSEPLPKAAYGGLIKGPSHAQGGAIIEAEGGEAIMTRRAVSMFGPMLSTLNVLGGGVPFAEPLSDGGYILRSYGSSGATADEIAAALEGVQIVTLVEDINRGQRNYADIQAAGSI